MDDLERRMLTLELETRHERELNNWRFEALSRQLQALERSPSATLSTGSTVKLLIAILLPLAVLLTTGDLRKVAAALRMTVGG